MSPRQSFAALIMLTVAALAWNLDTMAQNTRPSGRHEQDNRVLVASVMHRPETREISLPASIRGYIETPIYAKVAVYLKNIYVDKLAVVFLKTRKAPVFGLPDGRVPNRVRYLVGLLDHRPHRAMALVHETLLYGAL